jgi:hypothetical protein
MRTPSPSYKVSLHRRRGARPPRFLTGALAFGAIVSYSYAAWADFRVLESNIQSLPVGSTIRGNCISSELPAGAKVRVLDLAAGTAKTMCGSSADCASLAPWEQIGGLRKPCNPKDQ